VSVKMKGTGIVRKVDELGRVVLPVELRRAYNIKEKDALEIFVEDDRIILQKYNPGRVCVLTGEITPENKAFGNGDLILSPKGIDILKNQFKKDNLVKN
jgi:AbrB family transcriptional regulator, transcriptional pleiotropic regulator of transition state genes